MKRYLATLLFAICTGLLFAQSPEIPTIDFVTVDPLTQKVRVSWKFNNPQTIDGVVIVRQIWGVDGVIDGSFQDVAEIPGRVNTSYRDVSTTYGLPHPDLQQEVYRVKSYKEKDGVRVYSEQMSEPHALNFLEIPVFDPCQEIVKLKWTGYQGWEGSLASYIVYARAYPNKVFEQLATVGPTETSYAHKKPDLNVDYEYYISAVHRDKVTVSNSNLRELNTHTPQPPELFVANQASVNENNEIEVKFSVTPDATEILEYVVEWTTNLEQNNITYLSSYTPNEEGTIKYTHYGAKTDVVNYYRLKAVGNCGTEVGYTNWVHNLVLTVRITDLANSTNTVEWTPYSAIDGNTYSYDLYRIIDDSPSEFIGKHPSTVIQSIDKIEPLKDQLHNGNYLNGKFCYYVEATETDKLTPNTIGISASSIACVHYPKSVAVPNAINPYSTNPDNRIFLPKVSFISDYLLNIYNRWGNTIFTTTTPVEGWDGTGRGGVIAPQGTYIYYLEFRDSEGEWTRMQGQINIVY